ncbi:FAD dependent oxidoreductase [Amylostereum chailletii]|nr:FAD dependent oxidoreductase [Amylostereum chailletii]
MSAPPDNIVILGAGIIGLSTAYYLDRLSPTSTSITVLDASPSLFASASGRAAGFLARDWYTSATSALGALSFDLHRSLAAEHDGAHAWGYSSSIAYSLSEMTAKEGDARGEDWLFDNTSRAMMGREEGQANLPAWLAGGKEKNAEVISTSETTAQVDPLRLCEFLLEQCQQRGIDVLHPVTPTSLGTSPSHVLSDLTYIDANGVPTTIPCTHIILTAGVWTPDVYRKLFPKSPLQLPITALSGHSLVLRSPHWNPPTPDVTCHAAFASDEIAGFSPEIFSRAHGDIYLAGLNSAMLPVAPIVTDVHPDPASIDVLKDSARRLLGTDELDVVKESLCHRPVTPSGVPLLTRIGHQHTGVSGGVWVSAGHGPWGISLSLGTGLVLAELVLRRTPSADVSRLGL